MDTNSFYKIEEILGYSFNNKDLLRIAFTHSSIANAKGIDSNERMEFLGDSILNFIISDLIYHSGEIKEGEMSLIRSNIVSKEPLSKIIKKLKLDQFLKVTNAVAVSPNMRENLFEAVVAAIYLDCYNLDTVRDFVELHLSSAIKSSSNKLEKSKIDYKTLLQEKLQSKKTAIKYVDVGKSGADHEPIFEVAVVVNNETVGVGKARTKKEAGKLAAEQACKKFKFI